ncbi:uncharacterized protein AMSG_04814 [Thecamonas trahens ATCC 50062]|uniref:F-box domain-containing protein n=1 Tax=Thecamonas trahens ATCC 50062 TaxID=461836 RepID=A0A0L0D833_THETB|nr:hypothetical protein AMSG_04814 [Thecamonas trahens ATCC 50062]KNC48365.1 hypothetical protein AMSG_04814 [Thecamonas trahens ATCC 50062]|eukprot:XP_013758485.1 hypothetical protein AMSG_04814 [Thecamonas trahens ATCC 50062]
MPIIGMHIGMEGSGGDGDGVDHALTLVDLPVELLFLVCEFLSPYGVVVLSHVSSLFRRLLADDLLWRAVHRRCFGENPPQSEIEVLDIGLYARMWRVEVANLSPARLFTLKRAKRESPLMVAAWRAWGLALDARTAAEAAVSNVERLRWMIDAALVLWWGEYFDEAAAAAEAAAMEAAALVPTLDTDAIPPWAVADDCSLLDRLPIETTGVPQACQALGLRASADEPTSALAIAAAVLAGYVATTPMARVAHLRRGGELWAAAVTAPGASPPRTAVQRAFELLQCAARVATDAGQAEDALELGQATLAMANAHTEVLGEPGRMYYFLAAAMLAHGAYVDAADHFALYAASGHADRIQYSSSRFLELSILCRALGEGLGAACEALAVAADADARFFDSAAYYRTSHVLGLLNTADMDGMQSYLAHARLPPDSPRCQALRELVRRHMPGHGLGALLGDDEYEYYSDEV